MESKEEAIRVLLMYLVEECDWLRGPIFLKKKMIGGRRLPIQIRSDPEREREKKGSQFHLFLYLMLSNSSQSGLARILQGSSQWPKSSRVPQPLPLELSPTDEFHYVGEGVGGPIANSRLHPSMDDQEMEEIRSIGEQHEMEWNDSLNLATSAWWFKFLKAMEIGPDDDDKNIAEDYGCYPFDEVMEFPAWFNPNETCLQQHVDDTYSHPTLPCMDIEEIEGMDVEWLA